MAITLRRQLSDDDKARVLAIHGRRCFATGHVIADGESVHFDHIRAFSDGGLTELDNIAPMCEVHNKAKGRLPLEDFRVKLRLEAFFENGDALTLKDLLQNLRSDSDIQSYGEPVSATPMDKTIRIEDSRGRQQHYALYTCPTTGWRYFYATLPVDLLDSDDEENHKVGLQPRYLIFEKVFELFRHFQRHPVLQPSIGRIFQNRIVLFDGQHTIAALLWTGRREFECKIYVDPDLRLLNDTNISAHDRFAQTRFFSSIMVLKLGTEFGVDFENYKNLDDGLPKSEAGFMRYLDRDQQQAMSTAERNKRFRSYLYNSILQDPNNKLARFVSNGNRSTDEKPLTIDMLSKSLFAGFLYPHPVDDNMATDAYKRDHEIENNVELMNTLHDLTLEAWNPKAGPNDSEQHRFVRLFRSKSIMAWSELLRDAVCGKLDLQDAEDRARPFYRELTPTDLERVRKVVERLVSWKLWNSPPGSDIDRVLADNKSAVKEWLRSNGLTTGYLMGASE
jgi:hypothetical protein